MSEHYALLDLLGCPQCGAGLRRSGDGLHCEGGHAYAVRNGVPVLVTDPTQAQIHEGELEVWPGYEPTIGFMLNSLPSDAVILDLGSGNRALNDPRIVRCDVVLTPHVDVVADAHALPFRDGSLSMVYATAVFEHLHSPWLAAEEIWRVLKPGGYALVDCNFVFPFHGFPCVYFNASADGLRRLFSRFTELQVMAAPWQMPSFTLETLIGEYLRFFKARSAEEIQFAETLRGVLRHPLRRFDDCFAQADAQRIAAAVTYLGIKQPAGTDSLMPAFLRSLWATDAGLQARFPTIDQLIPDTSGPPMNLWHWCATEGRSRHPELARWFDERIPFHKGRWSGS